VEVGYIWRTETSANAATNESKDLLFVVGVGEGGVDGSCAKHLTVESYTVVMLLTFIFIIISIPSPRHSLISGLKHFFYVNSFHHGLSFLTDYVDSPDCLLILLSISVYYFLVFFLFYTFLLLVPCGILS